MKAMPSQRMRSSLLTMIIFFLGLSQIARATAELDRKFALETVGALKSWDNVDGLFAEYVASAYKEYFAKQSRFTYIDLNRADDLISKTKLPYHKLIDDPEVLGQISRSMRAETIVRTKIFKEGPRYRFTLEWLLSPKMDLLSSDTFNLEEPADGKKFGISDVQDSLNKSLDRMIGKLPFVANVTGRDDRSVTVNIGANANLRKGDTLVIGTLNEVKKHPLLHSIVDWKISQTGKVEVEEVDEAIAFCKVLEEEQGRQISRYQKVTHIIPRPELPTQPLVSTEEQERVRALAEMPKLGFGVGQLWVGSFSRQYSDSTNTTGKSGSGLFLGARAEGQLWLTREWFSELGFGFGSAGYSQSDILTGTPSTATGVTATATQFKIAGGYTYFASPNLLGTKGWVKLGYHSTSYNLPISDVTLEATAPISFKGLFLSVGGELPLRDQWGALLSFDFGFLTSASQTGLSIGSSTGSTDVAFFIGGFYRYSTRTTFRIGLDVTGHGADFSNNTTLTHKIVSFGPSVALYF